MEEEIRLTREPELFEKERTVYLVVRKLRHLYSFTYVYCNIHREAFDRWHN